MKKTLLFILCCHVMFVFSQVNTIHPPQVWLRADSSGLDLPHWRDVMDNHPALPESGVMPATYSLMNFNKSFETNAGDYFMIPSLGLERNAVTTMVVYQVMDSLEEQSLWSLNIPDSNRVGLSSQRILSERSAIRYRKDNNISAGHQ